MQGSSSIIGDAKYQELKMSFQFKMSGDNLFIIAHANNESYEGERVFDPDFDFQDIKQDLLNKHFKIISHTNEILKLKVGKYVNLELKNITKIQTTLLKQKMQDLTKLVKIEVEKNHSLQKTTLQLRTQMDQMTTKMADLMLLIAESYTTNKTLKNQINQCKQKIIVLELQKREDKNQLNEIKSQLNSQKHKLDKIDQEIKIINERAYFQQQMPQDLQTVLLKINQQSKQQKKFEKKEIEVQEKKYQEKKHNDKAKKTSLNLQNFGITIIKKNLGFMGISKIVVSFQEDAVLKSFLGSKWTSDLVQLKLLYRASQNDFSAHKFHEKCDHIKNTMVLVQTEFKKKIGGFTPLTWQNIDSDTFVKKSDMNCESFIFSLSNKHKLTLPQYRRQNAISSRKGYGPSFGWDDLTIYAGADKGAYSRADISSVYQNGNYKCKDKKSWESFCGNPNNSNKFRIYEWEVWELVLEA